MQRRALLASAALWALPKGVAGQEATPEASPAADNPILDLLPDAGDLPEGWTRQVLPPGPRTTFTFYSAARTFVGPNGARLIVSVYDLPTSIVARAEAWEEAADYWQLWANYYSHSGIPESQWIEPGQSAFQDRPLPNGVSDAIRFEGSDVTYALPAAVCLFSLESGPAMLINISGTIGDLSGLEACESLVEDAVQREP